MASDHLRRDCERQTIQGSACHYAMATQFYEVGGDLILPIHALGRRFALAEVITEALGPAASATKTFSTEQC